MTENYYLYTETKQLMLVTPVIDNIRKAILKHSGRSTDTIIPIRLFETKQIIFGYIVTRAHIHKSAEYEKLFQSR